MADWIVDERGYFRTGPLIVAFFVFLAVFTAWANRRLWTDLEAREAIWRLKEARKVATEVTLMRDERVQVSTGMLKLRQGQTYPLVKIAGEKALVRIGTGDEVEILLEATNLGVPSSK
jgi:hypothetical protein